MELSIELEIYVNEDGTVVFADLAADMLPVAGALCPSFIQEYFQKGLNDVSFHEGEDPDTRP